MPKSYRHQRMARKLGPKGPARREYYITDPNHRHDLRGEFAGVKVNSRRGKQVVVLSERQAKFYLDQGALTLVETDQDKNRRNPQQPQIRH